MEIFNLRRLNDVEVKEQHQVKIWNRFAALENLEDMDINMAWEITGQNIKVWATDSVG
jgi:hypothetical protein